MYLTGFLLSTFLSICLFNYPVWLPLCFVCLSNCRSVLYVCLFILFCVCFHLSVCRVCQLTNLSCLFIYASFMSVCFLCLYCMSLKLPCLFIYRVCIYINFVSLYIIHVYLSIKCVCLVICPVCLISVIVHQSPLYVCLSYLSTRKSIFFAFLSFHLS